MNTNPENKNSITVVYSTNITNFISSISEDDTNEISFQEIYNLLEQEDYHTDEEAFSFA